MDYNKELNKLIKTIIAESAKGGSPLKQKDIAITIGLEPSTLTKILNDHQKANQGHVALVKEHFRDLLEKRKYTDSLLDIELLGIHSMMEVVLRALSKLQADFATQADLPTGRDAADNLRKLKLEIELVSAEREK